MQGVARIGDTYDDDRTGDEGFRAVGRKSINLIRLLIGQFLKGNKVAL